MKPLSHSHLLTCLSFAFVSCAIQGPKAPNPSMKGPSVMQRHVDIQAEPKGNYFVGRRYYVEKTRFWGFVRKPRQPWNSSQLVLINESKTHAPDRFSENGRGNKRYGFDSNYEYELYGKFTGDKAYDPNSDQILPEFLLTGYKVKNPNPGWIFTPQDTYHSRRITLGP